MKRLLPIIFGGFGLLFLFFFAYFPVYAQTDPSSGLTAQQLENVDGRWVIDPEVTAIGKNASRSGLLLDWALRDYNWSYVNPGTTHPLLPFWVTLRNFVYSFMIVVIVVAAIVMIVTRGRSLTIRRFFPRFIIIAVLVTFSFSVVQVLYELVDIFQGFFVRPNGIPISQKDLLFIGWNYDPFIGLRMLGDANFEAAFTTLLFVKLTTFTYYVMVGMLLIRKVILWFFIIISPFFPLLLFFYPLRNTAKIWVGEFFRWLLYAPLFAIFLAALVAMWRTGIPLSFNFGSVNTASAIIFPTAVSILLGGPGQAVNQLNNLNIIDTYAQYLVAIMMLWGVIIVPWILLQIFLDYVSNFNVQNAPFFKNFSKYLSRPPIAPAPSTPPQTPIPPGGGVGRERSIPLIKDFKIPTITGLARPIPTGSSMSVKQITNMSIPTLRDIAKYESDAITNSEKSKEESQRIRETLTKIANPATITTQTERSEFERMRNTLKDQSLKGDKLAQSLLQASNTYSQSQKSTINTTNNVNSVINQLANPQTVTDRVERERIEKIRESVRTEAGTNNQLAKVLSQVTNTSSSISNVLATLSQNTEKTQILKEKIERESSSGNSFATTVLSTIQSLKNSERVSQALMNIHNPSRVENSLSRQEYKHVSESIASEKQRGSDFATHLTERLERLSTETRIEEKEKILSEIRESVLTARQEGNPLAGLILSQVKDLSEKRENTSISSLRDQFEKEVKSGNPLAVELSALAQKKELTEEEVHDLEQKVNEAKQNGDPLGVLLSDLLARRQRALEEENKPQESALPKMNRIQQVSLDDYEAVKKMWTENYENLEVPGAEGDGGRSAWIKDDIAQISETIDLLSSNNAEQVKAGMDKVSDILPFLLIGGFSQNEITAYLKAKLEAAKGVLTQIEKTTSVEDTQVYVEKKQTQIPKHMTVSQEVTNNQTAYQAPHDSSPRSVPQRVGGSSTTSFSQMPQTSESLLRLANISMPTLKRVAQFDRMLLSSKENTHPDILAFQKTLEGIATPQTVSDSTKRDYYSQIREKLLEQQTDAESPAASILKAIDVAATEKITEQLSQAASQIAFLKTLHSKPNESTDSDTKKFLERVSFDASSGDEFAKKLEKAVRDESVLADPLQKVALLSDVSEAYSDGNTLATTFVTLAEKHTSDDSEVYTNRLLRVYELLRSHGADNPSTDSSKTNQALIKRFAELKDEDMSEALVPLFEIRERMRTNGFNVADLLRADSIIVSQLPLIEKSVPGITQFLNQKSERLSLTDIVSQFSHQTDSSSRDPLVTELKKWGEDLSRSRVKVIEQLLEDLDDKTKYEKDTTLKTLRSKLEEKAETDSFAKALLSLSHDFANKSLTVEDVKTLIPSLFQRMETEVRAGNSIAFGFWDVLSKKLDEAKKVSTLHTLLIALSDPGHISGDRKEQITGLRTLLISEKGQGNSLASEVVEAVNSIVSKGTSQDADVIKALYEELLIQKDKQNAVALALVSEIDSQRESETLMDLGEVVRCLSDINSLAESEKPLYQALSQALEASASSSDAAAMSIRSAIEIVKTNGVDLSEARKIYALLTKNPTAEYSVVFSQILTSSMYTRSALATLGHLLQRLGKDTKEASDLLSGSDDLTKLVKQAVSSLSSQLPYEKRQEVLMQVRDGLIQYRDSKLSRTLHGMLVAERNKRLEDIFLKLLSSIASPDSIQVASEQSEIISLKKSIDSSNATDDFSVLLKGVLSVLGNSKNDANSDQLLLLVSSYIKSQADRGNEIASQVLSHITRSKADIDEAHIRTSIENEAKQGNMLARSILELLNSQKVVIEPVTLPSKNTFQEVSLEDYESVKRMWIEGYKQLDVPGSQTRSEWLADETRRIDQTINLLTSTDTAQKQKGMQYVSQILPFLLIGGFSEKEVVSYLKAKLEAAKAVTADLQEQAEEASTMAQASQINKVTEEKKQTVIEE